MVGGSDKEGKGEKSEVGCGWRWGRYLGKVGRGEDGVVGGI